MPTSANNQTRTRYTSEADYFSDPPTISINQLTRVVAKTCARWSTHYWAEVLAPKDGVMDLVNVGQLPEKTSDRIAYVDELFDWILERSLNDNIYTLFLDDRPIGPIRNDQMLYEYWNDRDSWFLNLSREQFVDIQKSLKKNHLPEDAIYDFSRQRCIRMESDGWFSRTMRWLGFSVEANRCYSPRQWENRDKENHNKGDWSSNRHEKLLG